LDIYFWANSKATSMQQAVNAVATSIQRAIDAKPVVQQGAGAAPAQAVEQRQGAEQAQAYLQGQTIDTTPASNNRSVA
jgi:hypothetical protein